MNSVSWRQIVGVALALGAVAWAVGTGAPNLLLEEKVVVIAGTATLFALFVWQEWRTMVFLSIALVVSMTAGFALAERTLPFLAT